MKNIYYPIVIVAVLMINIVMLFKSRYYNMGDLYNHATFIFSTVIDVVIIVLILIKYSKKRID